jgi:hypothetical protein
MYADNIMTSFEDMKELEKRLSHWEIVSKDYGLEVKL